MDKLSLGAANEIIERHKEGLERLKKEMVESGKFNQDGAELFYQLLEWIRQHSAMEDEDLIRKLEGMGIDKWGKEAKKKMYEAGFKNKHDYVFAMKIAEQNDVIQTSKDHKVTPDGVIYEGWNQWEN
jgi:polyhydroxyalkanoate synthesis regulator phasin